MAQINSNIPLTFIKSWTSMPTDTCAVEQTSSRLHVLVTSRGGALTPGNRQCIEEFIDAHLDEPLTIADMASHIRLSPSHFSRSFRATLRMTPHSYLMLRRLTKAQALMATSDMPLSQIALATGFSDQSHLSRRFHEKLGLTPSSFRRQHR